MIRNKKVVALLLFIIFNVHTIVFGEGQTSVINADAMWLRGTPIYIAPPYSGGWNSTNFGPIGYSKNYTDSNTAAVKNYVDSEFTVLNNLISSLTNTVGTATKTLFIQTSTVSLSAFTIGSTPTSIIGTGSGSGFTIPASVTAGKQYRINVQGYITTAPLLVNVATVPVSIYYGSTVIATNSLTGLTAGLSAAYFYGSTTVTFRSVGTSGVVKTDGSVDYMLTSQGPDYKMPLSVATTTTVNTTTAQALDVKLSFSNSLTGNSITITSVSLESLN